MLKYKYIIWDWNGTLLNDIGASLASVNDMLAARGREPIDIDYYKECIGVPIIKFYEKVFDMENEDYSLIIKQYNEGYLRHLKDFGLTEGAVEALEYFRKNGAKQVIVSSSNNEQLCRNAEKYGVSDYFDEMLGAGDYFAGSKIERARDYLRKNNAENDEILVIGDLEHDAEMADTLGADCILLTSGHEHPKRLENAKMPLINDLFSLIKMV
ncbi:MAG: HAD family hydrolase [Clostridia bacterium]|nr:HAD family hydrolase [Clostridia bacterium]